MENKGKVFGIGLSRTGTTSLATALTMLGYNTVHAVKASQIDSSEAATDTPVTARYRQLDKHYPGSKFILTTREIEGWLDSCEKWWYDLRTIGDWEIALEYAFCRGALYGVIDTFDREMFREAYYRHLDGVHAYFKDRPNDLLEIDITVGEGFEKLCPFLGKPLLNQPIPKLNTATHNDVDGQSRALYDYAAHYYHDGKIDLGKSTLASVIKKDPERWANRDWVLEWLATEARTLEPNTPEDFINTIFMNLPPEATDLRRLWQKAIARYHVSAAFDAYTHHENRTVRKHILPAILHSPFVVANRGFIKICVVSLFGIATISQLF